MKRELIRKLHKSFKDCAHERDGVEYWFARELFGELDAQVNVADGFAGGKRAVAAENEDAAAMGEHGTAVRALRT